MTMDELYQKFGKRIKTKCILCNNDNSEIMFKECINTPVFIPSEFSARRLRKNKSHYLTVKCKKCGLVRATDVICEQTANELYKYSDFFYNNISECVGSTYFYLFNNLLPDLNITASLLDIGCGNGNFLNKLAESGFNNITGVEPSNEAFKHTAQIIKQKIINDVFKSSYFEKNTFDVITSFHLLDHLYEPDVFLKDTLDILKPGGHLIIGCHNVDAWSARVLGDMSPIFDIEHIYLFSPSTIEGLLEKCGFKVLKVGKLINTYPLSYWLKIFPKTNFLNIILPKLIKDLTLTLNAGNIFALATKL